MMNHKNILLLAADSGEGPLGEMIDPVLREVWRAEGFHTSACYFSDLQRAHLDNAHAVILLRTPLPDQDTSDFAAKSEWVRDFVARGGGLLSLFTECYGKTEASLNELFGPWGLRFYFNRLVAQAGTVIERFPRFFEGVILPAVSAEGALGLITEGGHGTQHLTCVGDARWEPMLRGGAGMVSEPYKGAYLNCSGESIADPVLAARAEIGAGRVVAFPGSAPFWIVNPFIWRFDGLLHTQRNGAGGKFLLDAVRWLADTPRGRALQPDLNALPEPACLTKAQIFSFRRVGDEQQAALRQAKPQLIWIGSGEGPNPLRFGPGAHENGRHDAKTRRCHPSLCLPLLDYRELSEATWPAHRQAGRDASTPECRVVPGYELLDEEGVRSAVVSLEAFLKHELCYPNSTLLENVMIPHPGCLSILRTPLQNRIPAQRYGGYNLIEWEEGEEWEVLYRQLVASKYFIAPIAFSGAETWALVPPGSNAFDEMRRNRHSTFVTTGPRLETFTWEGPGLTEDDWEGFWYGYRTGDEAAIHLRVVADAPLTEVVLYDGEEILQTFAPKTAEFAIHLKLTLWRDRALHVTARDAAGGRLLATYPLYTRNLEFWGHVGSDQMNNYVNAMTPSPRGFLGVRGEFYDLFGFVTLGAGWGDYLRITPALRYSDFMPRQEISLILGSFNLHHPSALLSDGTRLRYLNDHRRVFSFCGADAQWFRSTMAGEHVDNDEQATETWHGRPVRPTRAFRAVPGVQAHDDYIVWRWAAGAPILVEVRKHFIVEPRLLTAEWLTFASNAHHLLPGLSVRSVGSVLWAADMPESAADSAGYKEWDNSHLLRSGGSSGQPLSIAGDVEIGHGGVGTFGLFPLGPERRYRCLLRRQPRELAVFFQTQLVPEERASGRFTISYLMAVFAEEASFDAVRDTIQRASGPSERRFSCLVAARSELDLDLLFPAFQGRPLYLEVEGLTPGTVAWQHGGRTRFASQAMQGRSFHQIASDAPRCYRLTGQDPA